MMALAEDQRFSFVQARVDLFRNQVQDFFQAMVREYKISVVCFEVADLLSQSLALYEGIGNLDNDWRRLVLRGEATYCPKTEDRIARLYSDWGGQANRLVRLYGRLASEFKVRRLNTANVDVLNSYLREVNGIETSDEEFFCHSKLIDLRDAAIDDFRSGNCEAVEAHN